MTNWVIMPYLDNLDQTLTAAQDALAQTVPDLKLLLIDNGSQQRLQDMDDSRIYCWRHQPSLLSLAATWNTALRFVWAAGGEHALVINNDVRLRRDTYQALLQVLRATQAWFVSGVGTAPAQFDAEAILSYDGASLLQDHRGGPDFSCFLIAKGCHQQYPFDEGFVPAFCEDLDYHRRLMLDGHRDKIFGVNLPFLHYGSQTLKTMEPEKRAKKEQQISVGSRAHYHAKWGGDVNQERYTRPFDPTSDQDHVTTPELQYGQAT